MRMPIRDEATNIFMGLPDDGARLELTHNHDVTEPYEIGTGYGHIAITADDLDGTLERLAGGRHRAGEAAVHGPRGRLADLLRRTRSGRLTEGRPLPMRGSSRDSLTATVAPRGSLDDPGAVPGSSSRRHVAFVDGHEAIIGQPPGERLIE